MSEFAADNEGKYGIDHFVLRTLALVFLTCYVAAFSGVITSRPWVIVFGTLGYACLPLFALLCVEAYKHAEKIGTLLIRNIIFAVLCAVPYRFAFYSQKSFTDIRSYFSMALTGFVCIGALMFYDKMKTKYQRIFCVAFLCAISYFIGMEFAPYLPIIVFVIFIYKKEQDGKDADAIETSNTERLKAMSERKYLFSKYSFIKISFFVVTLSVVVFAVSLLFSRIVSYKDAYPDELIRNMCMPGMLLSLPFIRIYNGREGINNKFIRVVFRAYYLLLLIGIVMIKFLFLYNYEGT